MNHNIVNIKGTPQGLVFYFDTEQAGFGQLCAALEEKLLSSGDFFINADYIIDMPSKFAEEEMAIIEGILKKYHIRKGQAIPHLIESDEKAEMVYQTAGGNSLLVTKSVRSGQRLSVRGNAVVMGDINPGGEIIATGNIVVMGCCRGVLHAGAEGAEESYILVYNMRAQQLRIAEHVATVPADAALSPLKLAMIQNNTIILTDYIPSQFKENSEEPEV
jgi:septum site-determining protein MinC